MVRMRAPNMFDGQSFVRFASRILKDVYAKTSLFRDSFFLRISNLWNALHSDLKSESNVNVFKNKLKHSTSLDYVLYSMLMTSVLSNLSAVTVVGLII